MPAFGVFLVRVIVLFLFVTVARIFFFFFLGSIDYKHVLFVLLFLNSQAPSLEVNGCVFFLLLTIIQNHA